MVARNTIEILGGKIDWKNFAGSERKAMVNGRLQVVNAEGKRGFAAVIDPEHSEIFFNNERITDPNFGQTLADMGYRVKIYPGREEGEPARYLLPVEVRYPDEEHRETSKFVPRMYMVNRYNEPELFDERDLFQFDESDIDKCNIVITNSTGRDQKTGEEYPKAWCNKGYFWINRDRCDEFFDNRNNGPMD